jgi:hypothetical protein
MPRKLIAALVLTIGLFAGNASAAADLPWIRYFATDADGVTTELYTGTRIPKGDYRLWALTSAGSFICTFSDVNGVQNTTTAYQPIQTFQIWPVLGEPVTLFVGNYRIEAMLFSGPDFSGWMLFDPAEAEFSVTKF